MTKIEWANRTWNPVTGCTRVSEGCDHCYMHRMYPRLKGFGTPGYSLEPDMIEEMPDRLGQPMLWKKPARIFVCSMSDFFHDDISGSYRDRMFRAMTQAATERGHIFMVLTKRPAIALSWWNGHRPRNNKDDFWHPNIWLGTSVEKQKYVSRIKLLKRMPEHITKFVSAEPLIDELDIRQWLMDGTVNWVIAGGESGPGARPMQEQWARHLREQCKASEVPYFLKQLGGARNKRGGELAVLDGVRYTEFPATPVPGR